jgi:hypothetical protein
MFLLKPKNFSATIFGEYLKSKKGTSLWKIIVYKYMKKGGGFLELQEQKRIENQQKLEELFYEKVDTTIEFIDSTTNFDLYFDDDHEELNLFLKSNRVDIDLSFKDDIIGEIEQFLEKYKLTPFNITNDTYKQIGYRGNEKLMNIVLEGCRAKETLTIYLNEDQMYTYSDATVVVANTTYFEKIVILLKEIKNNYISVTELDLLYVLAFTNTLCKKIVNHFFITLWSKNDVATCFNNFGIRCDNPYESAKIDDEIFDSIKENETKINQLFGLPPDSGILKYIEEPQTLRIIADETTLTIVKSSICYIYIRLDNIITLLGVVLSIVKANIITKEVTYSNKVRWTIDSNKLQKLYDKVRSTRDICKSNIEILDLITPIDFDDLDNKLKNSIEGLITKTQDLCVKYCEKRREGARYKSRQSCINNNCIDLYFFLRALRTFIIDRQKRITGEKYVSDDSFEIVLDKVIETLARVKIDKGKKENSFDIQSLSHEVKKDLLKNLIETKKVISGIDSNQYALVVKYFANKQGVRKYNFLGFKFGKYGGTRKSSKRKRSRKALKYCNKYLTRR